MFTSFQIFVVANLFTIWWNVLLSFLIFNHPYTPRITFLWLYVFLDFFCINVFRTVVSVWSLCVCVCALSDFDYGYYAGFIKRKVVFLPLLPIPYENSSFLKNVLVAFLATFLMFYLLMSLSFLSFESILITFVFLQNHSF